MNFAAVLGREAQNEALFLVPAFSITYHLSPLKIRQTRLPIQEADS